MTLNLLRLLMAVFFLAAGVWLISGSPVPVTTPSNWFWLALSGVVGLSVGDVLYFNSLKTMGPRLTLMLLSLAPPISAVGGWLLLSETLGILAVFGMAVTLFGVVWVITERKDKGAEARRGVTRKGVVFGAGAAFCQATGLVLSKMGLEGLDPVSGTLIRMVAATLVFAALFAFMGRWRTLRTAGRDGKGLLLALGGAFFGPFLGVTLSLVAVKHTETGVAMTILATTPVTILPFAALVYKEKLSIRAVAGAVVAVAGVCILFLR